MSHDRLCPHACDPRGIPVTVSRVFRYANGALETGSAVDRMR